MNATLKNIINSASNIVCSSSSQNSFVGDLRIQDSRQKHAEMTPAMVHRRVNRPSNMCYSIRFNNSFAAKIFELFIKAMSVIMRYTLCHCGGRNIHNKCCGAN